MRARHFLKVLPIAIVVIIGMLYFFQEKLIFQSSTLPQNFEYKFQTKFEELFLTAEDGAVLNGLHFKAKNPKGVIIYSHGNAGELDSWGKFGETLAKRYSYDVVVWDYRGYGKSTGKREQQAMLDDGFLFYKYCTQLYADGEIILYGRSLGGFFATHLAKSKSVKRLVLESTPATLLEVAKEKYPFVPIKWLLKYKFKNIENIAAIATPTYLIHGTDDDLVPFEHGQRLLELSKASKKEFFPIKGANHNDLSSFEAPYFSALDRILK